MSYDRLQEGLIEAGFNAFVETRRKAYDAPVMGLPPLPPGRCFRMHLVGFSKGPTASAGWRGDAPTALLLRDFLGLQLRQRCRTTRG